MYFPKEIVITISLLVFFAGTIFIVSPIFENPTIPTFYISVSGIFILQIISLIFSKKAEFKLSISEIIVIAFCVWNLFYIVLLERWNLNACLSIIATILFYIFIRRERINFSVFCCGISIISLIQAILGIGQFFNYFLNFSGIFKIGGTFDNPAGFAAALSIAVPFSIKIINSKNIYKKSLGIISLLFSVVLIFFSNSRSGEISVVCIFIFFIFYKIKDSFVWKRYNIIIITLAIIGLMIFLYVLFFQKKDSAEGRLLIWGCTVDMITNKFFLGYGEGGFLANYMDYQSRFFQKNPDSRYVVLADNVKHPFNEYLFFLSEHGILGIFFIILFLFRFFKELKRNNSLDQICCLLCIVGCCIFGLFSYPLKYPYVKYVLLFAVANIMNSEELIFIIKTSKIHKYLIIFIYLLLYGLSCYLFFLNFQWNKLAKKNLFSTSDMAIVQYETLYPYMKTDVFFLYNYAAVLNRSKEYIKSNEILLISKSYLTDIDTELLLADNYKQLNQYEDSEKCLKKASYMIPNRFIPLYNLLLLYEIKKDSINAKKVANEILNKQIKVDSYKVRQMKKRVRHDYPDL